MGDTSERSKPATLPPRCPCGFWGSSETMNLCSKCFDDIEKKPGEDCDSKPLQTLSSRRPKSPRTRLAARGKACRPQKPPTARCSRPQNVLGNQRRALRARRRRRSGPKNRRRCYRCQTKLELVQQELGSCRCGYVFCMLHRLPEQHDCLFDHLGRGREEAVLKMVKLDRKVGRSCQRIGEECS
ncbi:hypothetical protein JOQ06_004745 [Pogonophryne albipinna]|uniref:Zinc finger AN1-type containing 3 n=1 Tax=Pogonophryne albipinna TaxID=1090488 RepID=A0AAD6FBY6_9TELE|nr:hypothetical protein JOQ06_004745 [Pogonophryne albipinna]